VSERVPVRYRSADEDSARWTGFAFRDGDIVISTRSKSGTTWMQMICALLVFHRQICPSRSGRLSPWLDWLGTPPDEVYARLAAQDHRRFIKTHTPLDGIPLDERATYIVVGRHPLDMAVSLYHQGDNIDRARHPATHRPTRADNPPAPALRCTSGCCPGSTGTEARGISWILCPGCCGTPDAWARRRGAEHRARALRRSVG
jgi:aryl sulfotransferase